MKYYILTYDYEKGDKKKYIFCDEPYIGNIDRYSVEHGQRLDCWESGFSFKYDSEEDPVFSDYICNLYVWLMVSDFFLSSTSEYINEKNVQLLPVKLTDRSGRNEEKTVNVINVLDVVENALDMEKSDYIYVDAGDDEKVLSVKFYTLKENIVKGHDIFKLKEDTIPTFVSENIKKIIEKKKMKGFYFIEVGLS